MKRLHRYIKNKDKKKTTVKKKKANVKKAMAPATQHGRRSVYDPGKDQWIHYHVTTAEHQKGSWDSKQLREESKGYEKALRKFGNTTTTASSRKKAEQKKKES